MYEKMLTKNYFLIYLDEQEILIKFLFNIYSYWTSGDLIFIKYRLYNQTYSPQKQCQYMVFG